MNELKELFLESKKYTFKEIKKILNIDDETLYNQLQFLEEQGIIVESNGIFQKIPNNCLVSKIKICKNGCGVFYFDKDKYQIHPNDLNYALNNDLCLFLIDNETKQAKVRKIIKRFDNLVVCEFTNNKFKMYGGNCFIDIPDKETKKLVEGSRVLVRLKNDGLCGNIVEIIGHKDDPDIDLKHIAIKNTFCLSFSQDTIEELEKIPHEVKEEDLKDRLDLRDKLIYTIDCDNTKDMDDAISIEINEKGNYVLGVHIADVSHYIKYGSALFKDAYQRGTSVYMLNSVIPMIDKSLSNGICSLNPNVDRLTKSCIMEIDQNGNIVDYQIVKSVINSKKKMKYSEVNKILEENKIIPTYEPFIENLRLAQQLSIILSKNIQEKGYINFQSNDLSISLDENGKPLEFVINNQRTAEKIIENFMLLANQTVATNYCWMPFIYRVHEIPDEEVLKKVLDFLRIIHYKIPSVRSFDNPKIIQGILKKFSCDENFKIISNFILRGMKKARYSDYNLGHFALSFDNYTHFTSPIRRLCDLMVHILIDKYNDPNITQEELKELETILNDVSNQASMKEVKAIEAEREANMMKMAEYMEDHIGEYFNGKIINISASGITVEVNNIIGHVKIYDIKGDLYQFDPTLFIVKGRKTKDCYQIGDNVRIKVLSASKEFRTIDFEICQKLTKQKTLRLSS